MSGRRQWWIMEVKEILKGRGFCVSCGEFSQPQDVYCAKCRTKADAARRPGTSKREKALAIAQAITTVAHAIHRTFTSRWELLFAGGGHDKTLELGQIVLDKIVTDGEFCDTGCLLFDSESFACSAFKTSIDKQYNAERAADCIRLVG